MSYNIDLSEDPEIFKYLFKYINIYTKLDKVEYKNELFENDENNGDENYKPTIECDGDVKYIVKYENAKDDEEMIKFNEIISSYGAENIFFINFKQIILINKSFVNNDTRGANKCKLNMKFEPIVFMTGSSFHELVVSYYRIKSHKWDGWYEMYCNVDIDFGPSTELKTNIENKIYYDKIDYLQYYLLSLSFEHGS